MEVKKTNLGLMPNFIFLLSTVIMRIRGFFRNKKWEVLLTGAKKGDIILDYGCGIGFNTIPAANIVGNEGKVYALDIHPLAIKAVKKKIMKKRLKNVKILNDCGLSNESIDIILLYNVLPMIDDIPALIKEFWRILKLNGVLSVKSGLIVKLYGNKIKDRDLVKLITGYGFKLEKRTGKFYVFKKEVNKYGKKMAEIPS